MKRSASTDIKNTYLILKFLTLTKHTKRATSQRYPNPQIHHLVILEYYTLFITRGTFTRTQQTKTLPSSKSQPTQKTSILTVKAFSPLSPIERN